MTLLRHGVKFRLKNLITLTPSKFYVKVNLLRPVSPIYFLDTHCSFFAKEGFPGHPSSKDDFHTYIFWTPIVILYWILWILDYWIILDYFWTPIVILDFQF